MNGFPRTFPSKNAPPAIVALAEDLVPRLLVGDHPALDALRAQYERAQIESVELTGTGFFVNYAVPDDAPRAAPPNFEGGDARIEVNGVSHGAGCLLFVRNGQLDWFEGFTYGEPWHEAAKVLSVEDLVPVLPPPTSHT